jgi:soluble lytic murein transglycosylase-like protein
VFRAIAMAVLLLGTTTLTMSFAPFDSVVAPETIAPAIPEAAAPAAPAVAPQEVALRLSLDDGEDAADAPTDVVSTVAAEISLSKRLLINRWDPLITEASSRFGVPKAWIRAVMARESGGHTLGNGGRPIRSRAGAMGLMQLMPDTYADLRRQYGLGADPYDPHDNVIAGAAYLKWLRGRYGYPGLFAAYNHGPGNFEKHLQGRSALPRETRNYVAAVVASVGSRRTAPRETVRLRLATL